MSAQYRSRGLRSRQTRCFGDRHGKKSAPSVRVTLRGGKRTDAEFGGEGLESSWHLGDFCRRSHRQRNFQPGSHSGDVREQADRRAGARRQSRGSCTHMIDDPDLKFMLHDFRKRAARQVAREESGDKSPHSTCSRSLPFASFAPSCDHFFFPLRCPNPFSLVFAPVVASL